MHPGQCWGAVLVQSSLLGARRARLNPSALFWLGQGRRLSPLGFSAVPYSTKQGTGTTVLGATGKRLLLSCRATLWGGRGHPWVQAAPRKGSPRLLIPSPCTDPEPLSRGGCLAGAAGAQTEPNPSLALPCPPVSLRTAAGAPFCTSLLGFLPLPRTAALVSISQPGAYVLVMRPAQSRSFPGGSPAWDRGLRPQTPAGDLLWGQHPSRGTHTIGPHRQGVRGSPQGPPFLPTLRFGPFALREEAEGRK